MTTRKLNITTDLQSMTQAEQIHASLKKALMTGDLKPGETLAVSDVAELFSVSAMPVREAMLKLAGEGLIKNERKKAARVPELSLKEFREITTIRGEVEGLAVRNAIEHIGSDEVAHLEQLNERVRKAALGRKLQQYLRLNFEFHFYIYEFCDMPVLLETIERLMALAGPTLRRLGAKGMLYGGNDFHEEILKALRNRDENAAAAALRKDIDSSVAYIESLDAAPIDEHASLFSVVS